MPDSSSKKKPPYQRRYLDDELDELMPHLAAIAIEGAKGVGKTATASRRAATTFQFDQRAQREIIDSSPGLLSTSTSPVLLDEWQRVPDVWDVVRRAVDADRAGGQFILTGSAAPAANAAIHSGAGRIVPLRMRPLSLPERGLVKPAVSLRELLAGRAGAIAGHCPVDLRSYVDEIVNSGFPGIRNEPERVRRLLLESYIDRVVDRELPQLGISVRQPYALRGWLAAYAAATASTTNYQIIAQAANPGDGEAVSKTTALIYRNALLRLWILDPVPGWVPTCNPINRLRQSPKHHLVDPAVAAQLLGATPQSLLGGQSGLLSGDGALLGVLFESLAALSIRVAAQLAEAKVFHLRTRDDTHEVDFIVERADGGVVGIEVKLAAAINAADGRHLQWLHQKLGPRLVDKVIVNTGDTAYRRDDGIAVVPLALLGA